MTDIQENLNDITYVNIFLLAAVTTAAMLMGCSSQELIATFSTGKVQAGKDILKQVLILVLFINFLELLNALFRVFNAPMKYLIQAIETRDALAQFMYVSLFGWLIEKVNKSLGAGKRHTGRSINILDICGFESFKVCSLYYVNTGAPVNVC